VPSDLARLYALERERRASAEAVALRERELAAAKEFWTNTLVHDLKGPLALIVGWAELLERGPVSPLDPAQRRALSGIKQASRLLDDLVADINDSFRLEAQALPIHHAAVSPAELLRGTVEEFRGLDWPTPDLNVVGEPGRVLADERLVGRVLRNLIGNAYKHAGRHARVVLVAEEGLDSVLFAVDDDGPGIPSGERGRVFERFMQGAGTRHGSGLGLAFCKLVVDQLGGQIWADTSPLGGTRVAFRLPLARASQLALTARSESARPSHRVA